MSTQANVPPASSDEWQPASGGEVAHLARAMRTRKSRRRFLTMGAGAVGSLDAAVGGWTLIRGASREREYDFGGLTCSEVIACGQDFLQGWLSPAEAAKVKEHIRLCPRCRPKFEEMGGAALLG